MLGICTSDVQGPWYGEDKLPWSHAVSPQVHFRLQHAFSNAPGQGSLSTWQVAEPMGECAACVTRSLMGMPTEIGKARVKPQSKPCLKDH